MNRPGAHSISLASYCRIAPSLPLPRLLDLTSLSNLTTMGPTGWATRLTDISRQFVDGRHYQQVGGEGKRKVDSPCRPWWPA